MKFTEIVASRIENSKTSAELERNYTEGCKRCCNSGVNVRCDQCPVEPAYERMKNVVKLMEAIDKVED